jgi:hypothetical protein
MAGLAATISCPPSSADALAAALAARGADLARHRAGPTTLLVRAALPIVHEVDGCCAVIDGIAELSALLSAYRQKGPAGLLGGADAYALILRDPQRRGLVLARNGDGPPLYYARTASGVLVASEPEALLAAGVPTGPDDAVMAGYLATGACDETSQTFYAAIRRVLPGQVLALDAEVTDHTPAAREARRPHPMSARLSLRWAVSSGRIGVRLGAGPAGAAILGAALAQAGDEPVPVYSHRFQGLDDRAEYATTLLRPLPTESVRHRSLPFTADGLELDAFLEDVGEPLPDLDSYLLWVAAKATAGEVDALLDASAPGSHLSRLADRVSSRYGVELRFPRCGATADAGSAGEQTRPAASAPGASLRSAGEQTRPAASAPGASLRSAGEQTEWGTIARDTMPVPPSAYADESPLLPPLDAVLTRIGPQLAESMLHGQPPGQTRVAVEQLAAMLSGGRADAEVIFRRHVLAHWLRRWSPAVPASSSAPADVVAEGRSWRHVPVVTDLLHPGDPLPGKLAWYVAEAASGHTEPWYLLLAAKPVAITQGRARGVWEIKPGLAARGVAVLSGVAPWVAQTVVDYSSGTRALAAALAARLRLRRLEARLTTPAMRAVRPPRPDAAGIARVGVAGPPRSADAVAQKVVETLAKVLTEAECAALAGCAIIGPGARVWGWSGTGDPTVAAALAEGDPFGAGDLRTPVVLALAQPVRGPRSSPRKAGARKSRR